MLDRAKLEHLQVDHPNPGVIDRDRRHLKSRMGYSAHHSRNSGLIPVSSGHESREPRIARPLSGSGPELAEHRARGLLPANQAGNGSLVAEHHPQEIAPAVRERRRVMPDQPVRRVPHHVVEMPIIDRGNAGGGRVDQPLQPGKHIVRRASRALRWKDRPGRGCAGAGPGRAAAPGPPRRSPAPTRRCSGPVPARCTR